MKRCKLWKATPKVKRLTGKAKLQETSSKFVIGVLLVVFVLFGFRCIFVVFRLCETITILQDNNHELFGLMAWLYGE